MSRELSDVVAVQGTEDLRRVQRWFQAAISHRGGVRLGAEEAGAPAELLLTASGTMSAPARLSVYANAYDARLMQCLRAEYPALRAALDDDVFDAFAREFVALHPANDFALGELGARFPQFLAASREEGERSANGTGWSDFVVELATLERITRVAYDDDGPEIVPVADAARIDAALAADWREARIARAPWVRLCAFGFPVHAYARAARANSGTPLPEPRETYLAVARWDYAVRHHELTRAQHALLAALEGGATLRTALARSGHHAWRDAGAPPAVLRALLHGWARQGALASAEAAN